MSDFGPIVTRLPETTTAFSNKYGELAPLLRGVPQPILASVIREDLERVNRGQNPMSRRETALGILAAMNGQAVTPERDTNFFDYFKPTGENPIIRDALAIGASIPRIPGLLMQEARDLPRLPQYAAQAVQTADNPLEAVGNLATAPGLRMIPGSYVASNVLGGTARDPRTGQVQQQGSIAELGRHPLLTALDVIPAARAGLSALPAVRAAQEAAEAGAKVPLLRTALGRTLDEEGRLVPTRLSRGVQPWADTYHSTALGRSIDQAFGKQAREVTASRNVQQRIAQERNVPGERVLGRWIPGRTFDDPLSQWARESTELRFPEHFENSPRHRFAALDEDARRELTRKMERGDPLDMDNLSDIEEDFVREYQRINEVGKEFNLNQGSLVQVEMGGRPELLLPLEAGPIVGMQNLRARTVNLNRSWRVAAGYGDDVAPILGELGDVFRDETLGKQGKLRRAEADLYALQRQGYEVREALGVVKRAKRQAASVEEAANAVAEVRAAGARRTVPDFDATIESLAREGTYDRLVNNLRTAYRKEDWTRVRATIRKIRARVALKEDPGLAALYDEAELRLKTAEWVGKQKPLIGNEAIGRMTQKIKNLERKTVPARFRPLLQERLKAKLKREVDDRASMLYSDGVLVDALDEADFRPETFATGATSTVRRVGDEVIERGITGEEISRLIDEGNFEMIPSSVLDEADIRAIQSEVQRTWMDLREEGFDPVFVHHVRPDAANINGPIVVEQITNPTQVRRRTWDMTPYVEDAAVGLNHAAMEWLGRQGSEAFFDDVVGKVGREEQVLREELLPIARANVGDNPRLVRAELQRLIERDWVPFDPKSFMPWKKTFPQFPKGYRIPRAASDTIQRMHTPPSGRLSAIFDPGMKLFRVSVLPLSPRWHIYNIIGGGIMVSARTSPMAILRYARKAWEMTRDADALPVELSRGFGQLPREALEWNREAPIVDKISAGFHALGGAKMRELFEQARKTGRTVVQGSYDLNGRFDDMYRTIAYLEGTDKALTRGMSEAAAKEQGIRLANKILQDWDQITPVERQVMRYVFPFYGWMQHVLRYVYTYPIDHPIRASIVGKFARNELQDMDSGIGERFQNMFFIGQPDLNGRIRGINTSGLNPFADFGNYFTLAGFAGNAGPYIGSLLEMFGVDPVSGGPSLYPDLRFDPVAGRLVADTGNPLAQIASNFLPQSRILLNYTVNAAEWKDQLRRNPDAARRAIAGALGFPSLSRDVNYHQEQIDSELDRFEAQAAARREALRTGEYGEAYNYPGLRGFLDQIRSLGESGDLAPFQPGQTPTANVGVRNVFGVVNPLRAITAGPYDEQVRTLTSNLG